MKYSAAPNAALSRLENKTAGQLVERLLTMTNKELADFMESIISLRKLLNPEVLNRLIEDSQET